MADDARVFDVIAQFELRELLPFNERLTHLNGLRSLILIAAALTSTAQLLSPTWPSRGSYTGVQLEIVLSLSTHAGGVGGHAGVAELAPLGGLGGEQSRRP